mmetsp:Transcript_65543/g.185905  ORF Transcript_65543/g.185905 Transcript_65543/m.185905 type:complete len:122 (-) Transcript_65543:98-463(-)
MTAWRCWQQGNREISRRAGAKAKRAMPPAIPVASSATSTTISSPNAKQNPPKIPSDMQGHNSNNQAALATSNVKKSIMTKEGTANAEMELTPRVNIKEGGNRINMGNTMRVLDSILSSLRV